MQNVGIRDNGIGARLVVICGVVAHIDAVLEVVALQAVLIAEGKRACLLGLFLPGGCLPRRRRTGIDRLAAKESSCQSDGQNNDSVDGLLERRARVVLVRMRHAFSPIVRERAVVQRVFLRRHHTAYRVISLRAELLQAVVKAV